ncbi:MAG TPA: hypothetical protein VJS44_04705 [Pyrinomonadaceae bacterium]|nr:hypothetical protein [Pyrinomonadaceae bacterium]
MRMNEEQRKAANKERLELIDKTIRGLVLRVIEELEEKGWRPLLAKDVWRSPQRQLELFQQGRSQVRWGFHCAKRSDKPASLAADIVDADLQWSAVREFWIALGQAAKRYGLNWGGYFGLTKTQRTALSTYLDQPRGIKMPFGWDVAHVETSALTLKEARNLYS